MQILCSISLNDPLYLSKSAKHQDLANVQMSRIGSCDQRCNSDIWFWHIEVCLGLVKNTHQHDKEMPHQSYTSSMSIFFFQPWHLFEFLYKCFTDPHHHYPTILQIKSPTHKCVILCHLPQASLIQPSPCSLISSAATAKFPCSHRRTKHFAANVRPSKSSTCHVSERNGRMKSECS